MGDILKRMLYSIHVFWRPSLGRERRSAGQGSLQRAADGGGRAHDRGMMHRIRGSRLPVLGLEGLDLT